MNRLFLSSLALVIILYTSSCSQRTEFTIIWTDRAEFASYAELFNSSQNSHRVIVEYRDNPALSLNESKQLPDLVAGPWLAGERSRSALIPLDHLFNELRINGKNFYQPLLDLGNIGGRQYLFPVSFKIPAIIFAREQATLTQDNFLLDLDQLQSLSAGFNTLEGRTFTKMGFSPRWNTDFLYLSLRLFDVRFQEGRQAVTWNATALEQAITWITDFSTTTNRSTLDEDDFQFRYLYDPPNKLVTSGRTMFAYMPSDQLLTMSTDKLQNIDFRWLTDKQNIPVQDDIIFIGICRRARNLDGAEAFMAWFFSERTQTEILERNRIQGTLNRSFGIAGGFSSLRPVTERVLPLFYPALIGHLPPAESLETPRILPANWNSLRSQAIVPWLTEQTNGTAQAGQSLQERIAVWQKAN